MTLIDELKKNPNAKTNELPKPFHSEHADWVDYKLGVEIAENRPFLTEIVKAMVAAEIIGEGCNWDPYGEGYDEGPGELRDSWRKGGHISTGQWEGYVSDIPAVDALHAELLAIAQDVYENTGEIPTPEKIMTEVGKWLAPRSNEEREEATITKIKHLYSSLSTDGKQKVIDQSDRW